MHVCLRVVLSCSSDVCEHTLRFRAGMRARKYRAMPVHETVLVWSR
jgi:hypothetical protein